MCRLYGRWVDLSGRPLAFRSMKVTLLRAIGVPGIADATGGWGTTSATTNRNGDFYFDVPRGVEISVDLPELASWFVTAPDEEVAALFDYLFPRPVRLYWTESSLGDDVSATEIILGSGNVVTAPAAVPFYAGVGAEWSNKTACRIPRPNYVVTGEDEHELDGAATIVIHKDLPGTVILTSTEEEEAEISQVPLWERAGYVARPPVYLPPSTHTLSNPSPLNIVFV